MISFFFGASAYLLYARTPARLWAVALAVAAVSWIVAIIAWRASVTIPIVGLKLVLLLFPVTIYALALVERNWPSFGRFAWLGQISYSSYLLHFPLQMAVLAIAGGLGWSREVFYSPVTMSAFFAILIGLSLFCYRYFEAPLQERIRRFGC